MIGRAMMMGSRAVASTSKTQTFRSAGVMSKRFLATKFAESHEYVKDDGCVGITPFAANALGEVVYVELPEVGAEFEKGESFGSVESVKAASDVYAPVSGEVVAINEKLADNPSLVNSAALGDGWFIKIKPSNKDEKKDLLDEKAYNKHIKKSA